MAEQRNVTIGTLVLQITRGYAEQILLLDADGKELGRDTISQYDLDGFDTAMRDAASWVVKTHLPTVERSQYRRAQISPAELESGMLVEDEKGEVIGKVSALGKRELGVIQGFWEDGTSFVYGTTTGIWVRVPN
jgi:hypothetical protein